ncbi:MAG: hypothetical protein PHF76_10630 [Bacteroidales bacterium]|nr:hypothetical protein [Bacteroidales bacterium]
MIVRGIRTKHAVLRAVSFFGLYLGLCMFVLPMMLKGADTSVNSEQNELIDGHVITELILTGEYKTNYFRILLAKDSYLISLYDHNTNTVTESYSRNDETLTTWTAPAGIGVNDNIPRFESVFCEGNAPLHSDPITIEIWLAFCGNQESISNLLSQCPPAVMFPYLKQGMRNWPDFTYEVNYGGRGKKSLKELRIKSTSNRLVERDKLLSSGVSKDIIDTYPVAADGRVIFPTDENSGNGFYLFSLESFFSEDDIYPQKVEISRYREPQGGMQQITSRFLIYRDSVIRTNQEPLVPKFMEGRNTIRDYRFTGITNQPIFHGTKNCWPFKDSTNYASVHRMAGSVKHAMENEKKTNRPSTTLIVIILLAVFSPFGISLYKKV